MAFMDRLFRQKNLLATTSETISQAIHHGKVEDAYALTVANSELLQSTDRVDELLEVCVQELYDILGGDAKSWKERVTLAALVTNLCRLRAKGNTRAEEDIFHQHLWRARNRVGTQSETSTWIEEISQWCRKLMDLDETPLCNALLADAEPDTVEFLLRESSREWRKRCESVAWLGTRSLLPPDILFDERCHPKCTWQTCYDWGDPRQDLGHTECTIRRKLYAHRCQQYFGRQFFGIEWGKKERDPYKSVLYDIDSENNQSHFLQFLIKLSVDVNASCRGDRRLRPIHAACMLHRENVRPRWMTERYIGFVQLLLSMGADPNHRCKMVPSSFHPPLTALDCALCIGNEPRFDCDAAYEEARMPLVKAILDDSTWFRTVSIEPEESSVPPLLVAARYGALRACKFWVLSASIRLSTADYLQWIKNQLDKPQHSNATILHTSLKYLNPRVGRFLLKYGVATEQPSFDYPDMGAIRNGNIPNVRSDPITCPDKENWWLPLHTTVRAMCEDPRCQSLFRCCSSVQYLDVDNWEGYSSSQSALLSSSDKRSIDMLVTLLRPRVRRYRTDWTIPITLPTSSLLREVQSGSSALRIPKCRKCRRPDSRKNEDDTCCQHAWAITSMRVQSLATHISKYIPAEGVTTLTEENGERVLTLMMKMVNERIWSTLRKWRYDCHIKCKIPFLASQSRNNLWPVTVDVGDPVPQVCDVVGIDHGNQRFGIVQHVEGQKVIIRVMNDAYKTGFKTGYANVHKIERAGVLSILRRHDALATEVTEADRYEAREMSLIGLRHSSDFMGGNETQDRDGGGDIYDADVLYYDGEYVELYSKPIGPQLAKLAKEHLVRKQERSMASLTNILGPGIVDNNKDTGSVWDIVRAFHKSGKIDFSTAPNGTNGRGTTSTFAAPVAEKVPACCQKAQDARRKYYTNLIAFMLANVSGGSERLARIKEDCVKIVNMMTKHDPNLKERALEALNFTVYEAGDERGMGQEICREAQRPYDEGLENIKMRLFAESRNQSKLKRILSTTDDNGFTALILALTRLSPRTAIYLVNVGCDVNQEIRLGIRPLHAVCLLGSYNSVPCERLTPDVEVIRKLISLHEYKDYLESSEKTILDKAARIQADQISKYTFCLRRLLEEGADVNLATAAEYRSPLHLACRYGVTQLVRTILVHGKANVNALDFFYRTPFHECCENMLANSPNKDLSWTKIARLLLQHGAHIHYKDIDGKTAFELCGMESSWSLRREKNRGVKMRLFTVAYKYFSKNIKEAAKFACLTHKTKSLDVGISERCTDCSATRFPCDFHHGHGWPTFCYDCVMLQLCPDCFKGARHADCVLCSPDQPCLKHTFAAWSTQFKSSCIPEKTKRMASTLSQSSQQSLVEASKALEVKHCKVCQDQRHLLCKRHVESKKKLDPQSVKPNECRDCRSIALDAISWPARCLECDDRYTCDTCALRSYDPDCDGCSQSRHIATRSGGLSGMLEALGGGMAASRRPSESAPVAASRGTSRYDDVTPEEGSVNGDIKESPGLSRWHAAQRPKEMEILDLGAARKGGRSPRTSFGDDPPSPRSQSADAADRRSDDDGKPKTLLGRMFKKRVPSSDPEHPREGTVIHDLQRTQSVEVYEKLTKKRRASAESTDMNNTHFEEGWTKKVAHRVGERVSLAQAITQKPCHHHRVMGFELMKTVGKPELCSCRSAAMCHLHRQLTWEENVFTCGDCRERGKCCAKHEHEYQEPNCDGCRNKRRWWIRRMLEELIGPATAVTGLQAYSKEIRSVAMESNEPEMISAHKVAEKLMTDVTYVPNVKILKAERIYEVFSTEKAEDAGWNVDIIVQKPKLLNKNLAEVKQRRMFETKVRSELAQYLEITEDRVVATTSTSASTDAKTVKMTVKFKHQELIQLKDILDDPDTPRVGEFDASGGMLQKAYDGTLLASCKMGIYELIEPVLSKGANIEATAIPENENEPKNAVWWAAKHMEPACFDILIDKGAQPDKDSLALIEMCLRSQDPTEAWVMYNKILQRGTFFGHIRESEEGSGSEVLDFILSALTRLRTQLLDKSKQAKPSRNRKDNPEGGAIVRRSTLVPHHENQDPYVLVTPDILIDEDLPILDQPVNGHGYTVMHIAAQNGHHRTVDVLAKYNANVNCKNAYGKTPLHLAAEMGYEEVVSVLLANGGHPVFESVSASDHKNAHQVVEDDDGYTPYQIALLEHKRSRDHLLAITDAIGKKAPSKDRVLHRGILETNLSLQTRHMIKKGMVNEAVRRAVVKRFSEGDSRGAKAVTHVRTRFALQYTIVKFIPHLMFLMFLTTFAFNATTRNDPNTEYFSATIAQVYMEEEIYFNVDPTPSIWVFKNYFDVASTAEFWDWIGGPFERGLYDNSTGNLLSQVNGNIRLIGVPRMRQLRVKANTCNIADDFRSIGADCYGEYSSANEETNPWGPNNRYTWASATETGDVTVYGFRSPQFYLASGYILNLPTTRDEFRTQLTEMQDNDYISGATRVVFIDITTYNVNINLFCTLKLIIEFPPGGGAYPAWLMNTVRFFKYESGFDYFIACFEIIVMGVVFMYLAIEGKELKEDTRFYFTKVWNYLDLGTILFCVVLCVLRIWGLIEVAAIGNDLLETSSFVNVQRACLVLQLEQDTWSLTMLTVWLGSLKYFQTIPGPGPVSISVISTILSKPVMTFGIIFIIILVAFTHGFHILFGADVLEYRSFQETILYLIRFAVGDFNFEPYWESKGPLGAIIFLVYLVLGMLVLVNVLVAIMANTFHETIDQVDGLWNGKITRLMQEDENFMLEPHHRVKPLGFEIPRWLARFYWEELKGNVVTLFTCKWLRSEDEEENMEDEENQKMHHLVLSDPADRVLASEYKHIDDMEENEEKQSDLDQVRIQMEAALRRFAEREEFMKKLDYLQSTHHFLDRMADTSGDLLSDVPKNRALDPQRVDDFQREFSGK